jgi:hypothetical protein
MRDAESIAFLKLRAGDFFIGVNRRICVGLNTFLPESVN